MYLGCHPTSPYYRSHVGLRYPHPFHFLRCECKYTLCECKYKLFQCQHTRMRPRPDQQPLSAGRTRARADPDAAAHRWDRRYPTACPRLRHAGPGCQDVVAPSSIWINAVSVLMPATAWRRGEGAGLRSGGRPAVRKGLRWLSTRRARQPAPGAHPGGACAVTPPPDPAPLRFGAELVGTHVRYPWPVDCSNLGRVRRVLRRGGFSHMDSGLRLPESSSPRAAGPRRSPPRSSPPAY